MGIRGTRGAIIIALCFEIIDLELIFVKVNCWGWMPSVGNLAKQGQIRSSCAWHARIINMYLYKLVRTHVHSLV